MLGREGTPTTAPRPDIEGLRAIAVLVVMLWHAGVPGPTSGFVGVDIFFVLSGFLMTAQLIREQDRDGRASATAFWARRAKRILPAAGVTLLAVGVLSWLALPPVRWTTIAEDLWTSALFIVNWTFAGRSTDYLALGEAPSPLLHFWSLAVEMQFYVFWPLLFIVVAVTVRRLRSRWSTGRVTAAVLSLLVLVPSLWWSIVDTQREPERAYFLTRLRLWELALGGLIAAVVGLRPTAVRRWWSAPVAWLGLIGVLGSTFAFDHTTAYPGWAAILPTFSTAAVLATCMQAGAAGPLRVLSVPPLQRIGLWSYSLYLWHWPLIVLVANQFPRQSGHLNAVQGSLVVAASFLPAWLSYRFVETPLRRTPRWGLRPWAAALAVSTLVIGAGTSWVLTQRTETLVAQATTPPSSAPTATSPATPDDSAPGTPVPTDAGIRPTPLTARADIPSSYAGGCHVDFAVSEARTCTEGSTGPVIALVGDSHAAQWLPALAAAARSHGWRVLTMTKSSCPYGDQLLAIGKDNRPYTECADWVHNVERELLAQRPALVLTSGGDMPASAPDGPLPIAEGDRAIEAGYRAAWSRLVDAGIPVTVIRDTPRPDFDVVDCVSGHATDPAACTLPRDEALAHRRDAIGRAAAGAPGVSVIDLTDSICDRTRCPAVKDGLLIWRDAHHLTATFAQALAPALADGLPTLDR